MFLSACKVEFKPTTFTVTYNVETAHNLLHKAAAASLGCFCSMRILCPMNSWRETVGDEVKLKPVRIYSLHLIIDRPSAATAQGTNHKSPASCRARCLRVYFYAHLSGPTKCCLPSPLSLTASSCRAFPFSIKSCESFYTRDHSWVCPLSHLLYECGSAIVS